MDSYGSLCYSIDCDETSIFFSLLKVDGNYDKQKNEKKTNNIKTASKRNRSGWFFRWIKPNCNSSFFNKPTDFTPRAGYAGGKLNGYRIIIHITSVRNDRPLPTENVSEQIFVILQNELRLFAFLLNFNIDFEHKTLIKLTRRFGVYIKLPKQLDNIN